MKQQKQTRNVNRQNDTAKQIDEKREKEVVSTNNL